jgi:hypothetical protein
VAWGSFLWRRPSIIVAARAGVMNSIDGIGIVIVIVLLLWLLLRK